MFASLKNKIKEETGSDLTNLAPILSNPPLKISPSLFKGRHSRQGSGSSIGSISLDSAPADSVNDEPPSSPTSSKKLDISDQKLSEAKALSAKEMKRLEKKDDEWKRKLQKKDEEWAKRMEKREEEFRKQMEDHQKEWKRSLELLEKEKNVLEDEKREVVKQKLNLEDALKLAEEYKKKVIQYQEDIDQLEGFQTQEMAKIKHLLLVKEQELAEKVEALKESASQIEGLRTEVGRIHRYEEELSNVQDAAAKERVELEARLAAAEAHSSASDNQLQQLTASVESERSQVQALRSQLQQVQAQLQEEQGRSAELQGALGQERQDKDTILLRNAQVSQEVQLAQQAVREQQSEHAELLARTAALQEQLASKEKELEQQRSEAQVQAQRLGELEGVEHNRQAAQETERELRLALAQLEEQLADKNKSVRVLQQRLLDMKKTLQRELRGPTHVPDTPAPAHDTADGHAGAPAATNHSSRPEESDINFKYLKHVLIKFLTSREYEAQHLTRAVATLLKFTPEEERLLRETLDWKMSWFGTRPALGMGQTSKTIPPS